MSKPSLVLISPALASANNGNWQTALRWVRFLRPNYRVRLAAEWDGGPADIMIALHARRSAASIAAFAQSHPARPLIVVLTGTDLYRDIKNDESAQHSLELATRLVVLQQLGIEALPVSLRHKAVLIPQSAPAQRPQRPRPSSLSDVTMVGHLREVKNPACFMDAATITALPGVRFTQIGSALDPELGEKARSTQQNCPHYRWLGNMSHVKTRRIIGRSHLLVLPSHMEGGANVIIEAIRSGVPVLASHVAGNRGMLGEDYAGYFHADDPAALSSLIMRTIREQAFHHKLQRQCRRRAPLFSPIREHTALLYLLDNVSDNISEHP